MKRNMPCVFILITLKSEADNHGVLGFWGALSPLPPLLALMRAQRADLEVQLVACTALDALARGGASRAKAVVREGGVKALLFALRTHMKSPEVGLAAVSTLRHCSAVNDKVAAIMVAANAPPMLCAVLKRHDLLLPLQRDGCAALANLVLRSADGAKATVAAADGIEALVGGLVRCREREGGRVADPEALASGCDALLKLVEAEPGLLTRVERANGKRFLVTSPGGNP